MTVNEVLMPGETLGLMGGGQLGRMFAQAAATMGYHVVVLEPGKASPAGEVSREQIETKYDDESGLASLCGKVKAVTTEFENVPAPSLEFIEKAGLRVCPPSAAVAVTQDRIAEKHFVSKVAGVPVAPHAAVRCEADIDALDATLLPGILKTARLGYDGKGQARVSTVEDVRKAFRNFGSVDCVLEKRLALKLEVSVIVARNSHGETATFPVSENVHRNGILAVSILPARISEDTAMRAADTPLRSPARSTTSASFASNSSSLKTTRFLSMSLHRVPTTPAMPRSTRASRASTNNRFVRWPVLHSAPRNSTPTP